LVTLTEPHDSLQDQFNFVNAQVTRRSFLFDGREREVVEAELNKLTKDDFVKVINEILGRSLSVYVVAKCHEELYAKNTVDKVSEFAEVKASHTFYEDTVKRPLASFETLELSPTTVTVASTGAGINQSA